MKLTDLSAERLAWLRSLRYDHFIEKHEGPEPWSYLIDDPAQDGVLPATPALPLGGEPEEDDDLPERADFLTLDERAVLLPVSVTHHRHISVVRSIVSADGEALTLFLADTTFATSHAPDDTWRWCGRLAVCERAPGAEFYVTMVYHECFLDTDGTPLSVHASWR